MWNLVKIYKLSKSIMNRGRTNHYDQTSNSAENDVVALYGEMLFPFAVRYGQILRSSKEGRKILHGLGDKSEEHQRDVFIPKITDGKYLESLAPNTVGAAYKNLIDRWSFKELYEQRFISIDGESIIAQRRANISRHVFLAHDFWHVVFRYDTSPMGEACIQAVTAEYTKLPAPSWLGYLTAWKEHSITGSWDAFKVIREAHKLGKQAKKDFYNLSFDELLEMDIQEVRNQYNIGVPEKFYRYAKEHPTDFRHDAIHPEYNDVQIVNLAL